MTNQTVENMNKRFTFEEAYAYSNEYVGDLLKKNHGILGQVMKYLVQAQGKGVRTMLLLQCALGDDQMVPVEACKAAAAVELFHLATLVHDDVIDDAPTRRGVPSIQTEFGKKQAVIVGDYLLCLSFSTLTAIDRKSYSDEHMDVLSSFMAMAGRICTGEYNQLVHNYNIDIEYKDYYRTISGKTAALFWIAGYIGAALGQESERQAKKIARFAQVVGLIFQIIDDCKDYEMNETEALKPVQSDLKEGVITLPLIFAMAKDKSIRQDVERIFDGKLDALTIVDRVKHSGGVEESWALSKRYFKKAVKLLNGLESETKKSALRESLDQIFPALAN